MIFAPHPVEGLLVARAVSVNVNKACGLTAHEEVWCWGDRPQDIKDRVLQTTYTVAP